MGVLSYTKRKKWNSGLFGNDHTCNVYKTNVNILKQEGKFCLDGQSRGYQATSRNLWLGNEQSELGLCDQLLHT